jgi:rod shape-determining protein MreD
VSPVRIALNATFLLLIFVIQETLISPARLPLSGFSLYLAVLLSLVLLENRTGAVILGFVGGLILDLSPSSNAPFGQWALILTGVAYLVAVNAESIDEIVSRPVGVGLFVASGASLALILFLIFGSLLGESAGSLGRATIVIGGNFFWTMLITPFFMPLLLAIREVTIGARERI